HASALRILQGASVQLATTEPVRYAVRELMKNHIRVKRRVPVGGSDQAHIHHAPDTIGFSHHVCRSKYRPGMCASQDRISSSTRSGEVNFLKISRLLIEPQHVKEIVHVVAEVEDVNNLLFITLRLCGFK